MPAACPPSDVLTAFGISYPATRLSGGQGQTFRAGGWILKPAPNPTENEWIAETVAELDQNGFRVARHKRATSGAWVVSGWSAQEHLEGEHRAGTWPAIIEAGAALHRALAQIPRPTFLDARTDPWAVADRVAWGEQSREAYPELADALAPLARRLRPVSQPCQMIHGDLTGNVLFCEGQPPAVIDISPYWRPSAFAAAIVVIDALTWEGADPGLLASVETLPKIDQLLLRAAIWRLVELEETRRQSGREYSGALARHRSTHHRLFETLPE